MNAISILVTVGSDHHPFDRLIGWVDAWLGEQSPSEVSCTIQYGTAVRPTHGHSHDYLLHEDLTRLLGQSDVVVTQGGPMGIVEARRRGVKPIAIPRLKAHGEVVDDHQVDFCRHLAQIGDLVLAEDPVALRNALATATADAGAYQIDVAAANREIDQTVRRFGAHVSRLPPRRGVARLRRR